MNEFQPPPIIPKKNKVNKIIALVDEGKIDRDELIRDLLNWMYNSDLTEFIRENVTMSKFKEDFK